MTLKKQLENDELRKELEFEQTVQDLDRKLMEFGTRDQLKLDGQTDEIQIETSNARTLQ